MRDLWRYVRSGAARAVTRRVVRLAIVVLLAVAVGIGGYGASLVLLNPSPRGSDNWTLLASLPGARGETAAAVAGNRLYIIGGLTGLDFGVSDQVSVYDPEANTWEAASALPAPRHHAAAAAIDGTVYVTGGGAADGTAQDTLWELAPSSGDWRELAPMPERRIAHRMLAVGGRLYVVGGIGGQGGSGEVFIYDVAADAWSTGADMPSPRDHLVAVVVEDEIWAIGGRSGGAVHARVDIFDPRTGAWRDGPPLPDATSGASEAALDGVIMISGGEDPASGAVIDRHWRLDTRLGAGAEWEPMPAPPLVVHGAHGAALDGRFLIVGGAQRAGGFSRFAWTAATQAYDPTEGQAPS